jgi:hypothetical protein
VLLRSLRGLEENKLSCLRFNKGTSKNSLSLRQRVRVNAVDLSSAKPSPVGEGWVRGNKNKEKSLFKSPHPTLLPEGEGAFLNFYSLPILRPIPESLQK